MRIVIIWLGHASFKIKAGDKTTYMDPYEGEYGDEADLILVSHAHADHCDLVKIGRIRKEGTVVIAPSECASKIGGNMKTLKPGERITLGDVKVEAVAAYNYKRFRSPGIPFHPKGIGVGYVVTIGDRTIYHAGDTDFIPEMKDLRNIYLALLPNGGTYTMDNAEAAEAALAIKPEFIIPMHRRESNLSEFKSDVESRSKIKVILLKPGEEFEVS